MADNPKAASTPRWHQMFPALTEPEIARIRRFGTPKNYDWASALEAKMCSAETVVLVGGGNSAGQAAVFLSQHAAKVYILVRGRSLAASMSRRCSSSRWWCSRR